MEKSIESIWKQGFLHSDALVAPKLNNLYDRKSIHLIDTFKRKFSINLIAILLGSLLFLAISYLIGIPLTGWGFFITLIIIVIVNKRLTGELHKIDKTANSYTYLKAFDNWMRLQVRVNRIMARFYYPLFFLSLVLGFWHYQVDSQTLGARFTEMLVEQYPGISLIFGFPIGIILGVIFIMAMLSYFGGSLYEWDLKVVYGRVLQKLDEMIADMDDLRG